MSGTGPKHYAVAHGRYGPAVYNNWAAAKQSVDHVRFAVQICAHVPGAVHKSFSSPEAAAAFVDGYNKSSYGPTTPAFKGSK